MARKNRINLKQQTRKTVQRLLYSNLPCPFLLGRSFVSCLLFTIAEHFEQAKVESSLYTRISVGPVASATELEQAAPVPPTLRGTYLPERKLDKKPWKKRIKGQREVEKLRVNKSNLVSSVVESLLVRVITYTLIGDHAPKCTNEQSTQLPTHFEGISEIKRSSG
ncbi:hypothetical protein K435DRAFT_842037 [Dendrothele bispora CBS 962.96]|uniref:Uncharacterized protein n=1 Tax=Dendrothele bispora (strain CBS 962.96) TaxID=1314807 RepID=A0A4V4HDY9_DENBC|nr:hypothetical protein K435DRAFT_842037 [Dendrothele bispora CBS 962.96]